VQKRNKDLGSESGRKKHFIPFWRVSQLYIDNFEMKNVFAFQVFNHIGLGHLQTGGSGFREKIQGKFRAL